MKIGHNKLRAVEGQKSTGGKGKSFHVSLFTFRAAAFTLLEVMIALALFSLVALAIYSSFIAVVRGSKVGLESAAKVQRSRMAMKTIETALLCARSFDANTKYYWFVGENGADATLSFVAKLPESFPRSGKFGDFDVRRVTFSLEQSRDSGTQLVLRQQPLLMDLDVDEKEHPVIVAKDVKSFEMQFWDGRSRDWIDEWDQTNRIPPKVRISLQFSGPDSMHPGREEIKDIAPFAMAVPATWQRGGGAGGPNPGGLPPPGGVPSPVGRGLPPPAGSGGKQ